MPRFAVPLLCLLLSGAALPPQQPAPAPRVDLYGDPLPPGVLTRCGSNRLRHGDTPQIMLFTPDKKQLITASASSYRSGIGRFLVWDVATGKQLARFSIKVGSVITARLSQDGRFLESASGEDEHAEHCQFELATGRVVRRLPLHFAGNRLEALSLQADGTLWAAVTDARFNYKVIQFDPVVNKQLALFELKEPAGDTRMSFSPDGQWLAVSRTDTSLRLYSLPSGRLLQLLRPGSEKNWVSIYRQRCLFSPDSRWLVRTLDAGFAEDRLPGEVEVWNVQQGKRHLHFSRKAQWRFTPAFTHDSKHLLANTDRTYLLEAETGKVITKFPYGAGLSHTAFTPDGQLLVAANASGELSFWDVKAGKLLPLPQSLSDKTWVDRLEFDQASKRLFAGGLDAWDPLTGKQLEQWQSRFRPRDVADDSMQLSVGSRKVVVSHKVTSQPIFSWESMQEHVHDAVVLPDTKQLVIFTDKAIHLWDLVTRKELFRQISGGYVHRNYQLTGDSRWLAYKDDDDSIHVLDLLTGREVWKQSGPFQFFALSPNGRWLATGEERDPARKGTTGKVWDTATGALRYHLHGAAGHLQCMAFTPDSRMLTVGCRKGTLCLWEMATGLQRAWFTGHDTCIDALAISPNGRLLAAASLDAPIYIWEVHGHQVRPLTPGELETAWQQLLGKDAAVAFQAVQRLAATPALAVPFLEQRLTPAQGLTAERVRQLIEQLDSPQFTQRQDAATALATVDGPLLAVFREALQGQRSPEVRRRLEALLRQAETVAPPLLRQLRAVESLEWMATRDARRLLDHLATGAPGAALTLEAQATVKRLREQNQHLGFWQRLAFFHGP